MKYEVGGSRRSCQEKLPPRKSGLQRENAWDEQEVLTKEAKPTGYTTICNFDNPQWRNDDDVSYNDYSVDNIYSVW